MKTKKKTEKEKEKKGKQGKKKKKGALSANRPARQPEGPRVCAAWWGAAKHSPRARKAASESVRPRIRERE
jgi:hypothetical protein